MRYIPLPKIFPEVIELSLFTLDYKVAQTSSNFFFFTEVIYFIRQELFFLQKSVEQ